MDLRRYDSGAVFCDYELEKAGLRHHSDHITIKAWGVFNICHCGMRFSLEISISLRHPSRVASNLQAVTTIYWAKTLNRHYQDPIDVWVQHDPALIVRCLNAEWQRFWIRSIWH